MTTKYKTTYKTMYKSKTKTNSNIKYRKRNQKRNKQKRTQGTQGTQGTQATQATQATPATQGTRDSLFTFRLDVTFSFFERSESKNDCNAIKHVCPHEIDLYIYIYMVKLCDKKKYEERIYTLLP